MDVVAGYQTHQRLFTSLFGLSGHERQQAEARVSELHNVHRTSRFGDTDGDTVAADLRSQWCCRDSRFGAWTDSVCSNPRTICADSSVNLSKRFGRRRVLAEDWLRAP